MSDTTVPKPSIVVARPVSEALLNEKVYYTCQATRCLCRKLQLTSTDNCTVGSLPLQFPHQIHPRSRLRRCLLSPPVQAESMARLRRNRIRSRTGVRGVQLQSQAGGEGYQEAGMS